MNMKELISASRMSFRCDYDVRVAVCDQYFDRQSTHGSITLNGM